MKILKAVKILFGFLYFKHLGFDRHFLINKWSYSFNYLFIRIVLIRMLLLRILVIFFITRDLRLTYRITHFHSLVIFLILFTFLILALIIHQYPRLFDLGQSLLCWFLQLFKHFLKLASFISSFFCSRLRFLLLIVWFLFGLISSHGFLIHSFVFVSSTKLWCKLWDLSFK